MLLENGYGDVLLDWNIGITFLFFNLIRNSRSRAGRRMTAGLKREWGVSPRAAGAVSVEVACR